MRGVLFLMLIAFSATASGVGPTSGPGTTRPSATEPSTTRAAVAQPAVDPVAQKMKAAVRTQAQNWMDALLADKFDVFAAGIHPQVLEQMGGREKVVAALTAGKKKAKSDGNSITGATAGEVRLVKTINGNSYAIVPEVLEITYPKAVGVQESFLLAISGDAGKKWTFVDGGVGEKQLRTMFPDLPADFEIPKPKKANGAKKNK